MNRSSFAILCVISSWITAQRVILVFWWRLRPSHLNLCVPPRPHTSPRSHTHTHISSLHTPLNFVYLLRCQNCTSVLAEHVYHVHVHHVSVDAEGRPIGDEDREAHRHHRGLWHRPRPGELLARIGVDAVAVNHHGIIDSSCSTHHQTCCIGPSPCLWA